MLIVLRFADQSKPVMDKLHFYVRRMDETMEKSIQILDDAERKLAANIAKNQFFGRLIEDKKALDDDDDDSDSSDDEEEDEDEESTNNEDGPTTMGEKADKHWKNRRQKLITDFSIAGWLLSPIPEIYEDAKGNKTGDDHDALERLLKKMMVPDEKQDDEDFVAETINTFWAEYDAFSSKVKPYDRPNAWHAQNPDLVAGDSHFWHKKNSLPYAKVLGKFACRVCSKIIGMGSAERAWGDVKHLKTDKRSHLDANALKKQAVIFGASCMDEARIEKTEQSGLKFWTEEDFDKEFDMLSKTTSSKYGGLSFYDVDTKKMFFIDSQNLQWTRATAQGGGYSVVAYNELYDPNDPNREDNTEPFAIFEGCPLHYLLKVYYNKHTETGIKVLNKDGEVDDVDDEVVVPDAEITKNDDDDTDSEDG
jgi:hypothetical protein